MAQKLKKIAQKLGNMGRDGDTIVAHINPREAAILKAMGGSGSINPKTGLIEFRVGGGGASSNSDGQGNAGGRGGSAGSNSAGGRSGSASSSSGGSHVGGNGLGGALGSVANAIGGIANAAAAAGRVGSAIGRGMSNPSDKGGQRATAQDARNATAAREATHANSQAGFFANPLDQINDIIADPVAAIGEYAMPSARGPGAILGTMMGPLGPIANAFGSLADYARAHGMNVTDANRTNSEQSYGDDSRYNLRPATRPTQPPAAEYARPGQVDMPGILGFDPAMTNLMRRSVIATYGTQGTDGAYRRPDTMNYYGNLLQRDLINDRGGVNSSENVLPVERQYLEKIFGYNPQIAIPDLLRALATRRA